MTPFDSSRCTIQRTLRATTAEQKKNPFPLVLPDSGEENRDPFLSWPQPGAPVGSGPKSALSLRSTAAACRFYRGKRPPLTCEWADRNSPHLESALQPSSSNCKARWLPRSQLPSAPSGLPGRGCVCVCVCFPPDGPQGHRSTSPKFRLLAVPPPTPRLNALEGWSQPRLPMPVRKGFRGPRA